MKHALLAAALCLSALAADRNADAPYLMLQDPVFVYNNWSSYDELSDNVPLTEQLAMKELDNVLRLRAHGVPFDYYMMDAFWFAKDGGYREWRKQTWPNGPDAWLRRCRENGLKPGMWFGTNLLVQLDAAPEWRDSLNRDGSAMCMFRGGFLPHFMRTLQMWHDRGVRMFKFDFVDFGAAPPDVEATMSKDEIRTRNQTAFREALLRFRQANPGVLLVGFNGFGGDLDMTTEFPFKNAVDLRWLTAFDSLYTGDPRPSDVPMMNFWRSQDVYGDHMVRRFEDSGMPLERLDATSVMYGNTGTIYYRRTAAWKSGLLLMLARGGLVNTLHGNLELIDDRMAEWMGRAYRLYVPMLALGRTKTFGGIPGEREPYGYGSADANGALYTVVNPSQEVRSIALPPLSRAQTEYRDRRILFTDEGFEPKLSGNSIALGPEQMALVGFGKYAAAQYDFGIEHDVVIPRRIEPVAATFAAQGDHAVEATLTPGSGGVLRIAMRESTPDGYIRRTWAGGPPKGRNMAEVFRIEVTQDGRAIPVRVNYDKVIWSGLSWAVGEVDGFTAGRPVTIRCTSAEKDPVRLDVRVYRVRY